MAQIRNRFEIQNEIKEDEIRQLPDFFDSSDEIKPIAGISLSFMVHIVFAVAMVVITIVQGIIFPLLPKPELPSKEIEFKLVQNTSKPPINKNTNIRSDRDSQAGGKHEAKKPVSEPRPASAPAKKSVQKQPPKKVVEQQAPKKVQKPAEKPVQKPKVQQVQKPIQPQKVVEQPTLAKPSQVKPTVKPVVKPVVKPQGIAAPSAPKIVSAPKSPFAVAVPKVSAPVGTTYKPSGTPSVGSGGSPAQGAPAPKFSASGSPSSPSGSPSAKAGQYASKGSYGGYGNPGNPSPGNPNGIPGIDAIKEPNWGPYMRDLESRIKSNWFPPKGDSSKRVVINFTIGRDGRLLSHRVVKSSGIPLADRAAMSAIESTAPFRPLPPEFRGQSVAIEFTFDYNVLNRIIR